MLQALLERAAYDPYIFKKLRQFVQAKRLRAVNEGLFRRRMKVHKHHIGTGNDTLRRNVHYIENVVVAAKTASDGV